VTLKFSQGAKSLVRIWYTGDKGSRIAINTTQLKQGAIHHRTN